MSPYFFLDEGAQPHPRRGPGTIRGRRFPLASLLLALALADGGASRAAVVINEVHYHPPSPDGKTLEFVELYNTGPDAVDLEGWRLEEGISYRFEKGARIGADGHVVVARNVEEFVRVFADAAAGTYGNFEGSLDNGGDALVLRDAFGAVHDALIYEDGAPWPSGADGDGASLQRICPSAPSQHFENWSGEFFEAPSPLAPNVRRTCPPPAGKTGLVTFSEIHYHPFRDADAAEEYVELYNPNAEPLSLRGWKLAGGIEFEFPDDASSTIDGLGYLVVCRDVESMRERFEIEGNSVGNYTGRLSNRRERIRLLDEAGALVDTVCYRDEDPWPAMADGEGASLEKFVETSRSDDVASWGASRFPRDGSFHHVEATGLIAPSSIQRFLLSLDGAGEFVVDNVSLTLADGDGSEIISFGDFEDAELKGWTFRGVAGDSVVEEGIGVEASRGLRLISSGSCDGECQTADAVEFRFSARDLDLNRELPYRLSMDYRWLRGSVRISARIQNGVDARPLRELVTPGRANSRAEERVPPTLSHRGRFPREPVPEEPVWLSIRARSPSGEPIESVELRYTRDGAETILPMRDDGLNLDGDADDGIYGAELPAFAHNDQITYRFTVGMPDGSEFPYPSPADPLAPLASEAYGFYVNDDTVDSALPVYHVLVPGVDPVNPSNINAALSCNVLRPGGFAHEGELYPAIDIRFRGNTACRILKRNLKLRFQRGRYFEGLRKMNLQGIWTDKALVREDLAWKFVGEIGAPHCETRFVRVHLNGAYHGLHLYLEHPDRRFLQRNGLDPESPLYKASQPPRNGETPIGVARKVSLAQYALAWEEETVEDGDFSDIGAFIDALHEDGMRPGGPSVDFMEEKVDPEILIGYQLSQVVLNNIDSFAKNHFLQMDPESGRWGLITWDMDLTFGKFFDPDAVGPGREAGTLNDCLLGPESNLSPWFSTTVRGNRLLHHLVDFFFRAGRNHYQRAYLVRLWDLLMEKYTPSVYDRRFDELRAYLDREQADDFLRWSRWPSNPGCERPPDMDFHIAQAKEQLRFHRDFLIDYISRFHSTIVDHDRMKITELMVNPEGVGEELEFVELLNTSGRRIDISRWELTGAIDYVFPEESIVEAGETIVVVKSFEAFAARYPDRVSRLAVFGDYRGRLANEGEVLRLVDAGPGYPATIDYLHYRDGRDGWPEIPDGHSLQLGRITATRDNDPGENWRVSELPGGAPGEVLTPFLRGDADDDGSIAIEDVFFVIDYLFLGASLPSCPDSADANDDGRINVGDPVRILRYLFLGDQLPAPFPSAGVDLSEDELPCR